MMLHFFLQHEAQLADYKSQLSVIREELLAADRILEDVLYSNYMMI